VRTGRILYAGIDIGSLSTDVVLLDGDLAIVGSAITATGASTRKAAREALDIALRAGEAMEQEIAFTVATGRGTSSPVRSPSSISAARTAK
jgi:activator of 2-hydroxyglutaryl-CoA dehydratase